MDSSTDQNADNYIYTVSFSAAQLQQLLTGLGLAPDLSAPEGWFGEAALTPSGYVASLPVCGQTVTGPALRKALGLRSACFTVQYQNGSFFFTTRGYGHGVGMSQWGARALAEQGQTASQILAHYLSLIHISEPTRRTPISYAVFCLKKKKRKKMTLINISEPKRKTYHKRQ